MHRDRLHGEIIEMKILSIDPQIKSAHSGYRYQAIEIMSIQHKSSELRNSYETNFVFKNYDNHMIKVVVS